MRKASPSDKTPCARFPAQAGRKLKGCQCAAGIAPPKGSPPHRARVIRQFEFAFQPAFVLESPADDRSDILVGESLELNDARAGYQRRVHFEKRVLRRSADKAEKAPARQVREQGAWPGVLCLLCERIQLSPAVAWAFFHRASPLCLDAQPESDTFCSAGVRAQERQPRHRA